MKKYILTITGKATRYIESGVEAYTQFNEEVAIIKSQAVSYRKTAKPGARLEVKLERQDDYSCPKEIVDQYIVVF